MRARHTSASLAVVLALVAGIVTVTVPAPVAAATVTLGTVRSQMADHRGQDSGTTGNCITYAPPGTATSSALVASPGEAQTGHGRPTSNANSCSTTLNSATQSVVGFRPSATSSVQDGAQFLIGRMIHYNNPVYTADRYFTGALNVVLGGFTAPNSLSFPWQLDETPNTPGDVDDEIAFTSQVSNVTLTQGGLTFRLLISGFVPVATGATCPAAPAAAPQNRFSTVERQQTHACLYASLAQVRSLTIVKQVAGSPPGAKAFGFTSTSALAGSPWSNSTFSLNGGGSKTETLDSGNTVTVTETDPGDDRWTLTALTCTQTGADGNPQPVPGATLNVAARQVVLANVPPPPNLAQPGITCTYTNTYTPKATLTLVKSVQSGTAAPSLWTLTATGSVAPPPAGTVVSGPSGSPAVTTQRVPAGGYALAETGTGAAATGYVQVGAWVCRTAAGATVPVTAGTVTLADSAAATSSANVTCTATNRLATGSLQILKTVDAPTGAYTGGSAKTFAGSYDCGAGATGSFTTLTIAAPLTIANIPAGRACTVTETPPAGGLLNASYAWGPATYSTQPVTIVDQGTAQVTITNHVVQRFGTFTVTKAISGPGGFIGGPSRVFPVAYTCTLTNGPTTSGSLDVTTAQAVAPASPVPTGSVCSFSETLAAQPGDFSGPSYVWTPPPTVEPATVTVGVGTNASVTITNVYAREFGSLVVAKTVVGDGYVGGGGANFTVLYDCGTGFTGAVTVANGASTTIGGLPARITCAVQEVPPAPNLLSPAFVWGTPTWSPGPIAVVPANASTTLTVSNPTSPVFGRVAVTKTVGGASQGVTSDASFIVTAVCDNGATIPFALGVDGTASTPDLPVGTTCTISEAAPSGGLVDGSFAWGPPPAPQVVTITSAGQVVAVTVPNTVVRVTGQLAIAKAPITPAGIVDAGRTYAVDYRCVYGSDAAVTGTVTLSAGGAALTTPPVLVGSSCTVAEDAGALAAPPSATDQSWVWLPTTYDPPQPFVVTTAATVTVTATNSIRQLSGGFAVTKIVTGEGKDGGYPPGATFAFDWDCGAAGGSFSIADGESFDSDVIPAFTSCTVTETATPPPASPAYGWDPVQFSVNGVASGSGGSVTFEVPTTGAVQVNVTNPITPRTSSLVVSKDVIGETAGLAPGAPPFAVTATCSGGRSYQLAVPAGGTARQDGIPVGAVCTVTESTPSGGLVDASYGWGATTYVPADGTVTIASGRTVLVGVVNEIVRVTAPVQLLKTYAGAQGIIDPARQYPVTWQCTYGGAVVAEGNILVTAGPPGVTLADDVPLTSACTATEGDLGPPSIDPAFRWLDPVITGTTVTAGGPNTVTVANTLTRDSGTVFVRKQVIGDTSGYVGTGEDFTLHGQCLVPDHPEIPTRYADGTIADGGEVPITASIGWTCSGYEDTPGPELLRDASYAWGPAILDPAGTFTLTRDSPTIVFLAQNPIVRVRSSLSVSKVVVDPNGVVDATAAFTGTWSCQYGTDDPVTGTWAITPAAEPAATVADDILLGSQCTVTEDAPGTTGLPDGSWTWATPEVGPPATVVAGGTATVTVTNTVQRLYAGLQVTKSVVDPDGGVLPGAQFAGVWTCTQGDATYSDRFTVGFDAPAVLFAPSDALIPATADCSVIEDTLDVEHLRDASFAWGDPTYEPEDVTLVTGETATIGITNTVIRLYSDVTIRKVVTGPAEGLIPDDRPFDGTVTCQYGTDDPIETTWLATLAEPALRSGVLVGSVCTATESGPGFGGQPVDGDPSYIWLPPVISDPVTVTPPDTATPPIVVTNPTDRLFGTFNVTKTVTGAIEGIVDPTAPYVMAWTCTDGLGNVSTGELSVIADGVDAVGPEEEIPTGSDCTLAEALDTMPALRDGAWSWLDPTFTVEGEPAAVEDVIDDGRTLTFTIPAPQEDEPEPDVAIGVTNTVERAFGAWNVTKSSDPPAGSVVQPGSVVTYTLTLGSTGAVPVHDVVITDDLAGVLVSASVVDGSLTAPAGTTATIDADARRLVWTADTVDHDTTLTLTYQVVIDPGAGGVTITNAITASADVPPGTCASGAPADPPCAVSISTSQTAYVAKEVVGKPTRDASSGDWTVVYRITVTNPDAVGDAPYTVSDQLGLAPGFVVRSAAVTTAPEGVTLASPAWDGVANTVIATGAVVGAGAIDVYEITVRVSVPPTTPVAVLACASNPEAAGSGLFNSAEVSSLGATSSDAACASVPRVVQITKQWVIDGRSFAQGSQPSGYRAQLTVNSADWAWGASFERDETSIAVLGERFTVPTGCTTTSSGLGRAPLPTAVTTLRVTNTVRCGGSLPWTGFTGWALVLWATALVAAGVALVLATRRRRRAAAAR